MHGLRWQAALLKQMPLQQLHWQQMMRQGLILTRQRLASFVCLCFLQLHPR
jgi:hypothetical protein